MEGFLADLRYGIRVLRRSPGFAAVTVLTLALGIGANTAIFSTVDAVLLRALPYGEPDRIVMLWEDASFASFPKNTPAPGNYSEWRARNKVFSEVAATRGATASLTADGTPEMVLGRAVTANFFRALQAPPALGRAFTDAEDQAGAPVVVISYGLWQRRYGGEPAVIGKTMTMNGAAKTVIGVMPRGFAFRNREIDYWVPASFTPADLAQRSSHFLNVVARMKPGVTLAQARDDMNTLAAQMRADDRDHNARLGIVVTPIAEEVLGDTRQQLLILMGAAGCVLLIACANLASLLLSRAVGRRGELGVRAALGAASGRLVRQLVAEAMLLAVAGGIIGLLLAPIGMTVVGGLVPTGLPRFSASMIDTRVLAFALGLSVLTGIVFSIVPATQAARASLGDALQQASRGSVGGRHGWMRDGLVVLQVSSALVLLVAAGLMLRSLMNVRGLDLGFRPDHLMTFRTTLPPQKYRDVTARAAFYERVLARLQGAPGIESAAFGSTLPFLSAGNTTGYRIENRQAPPDDPLDTLLRVGTSAYLRALAVQPIEGRLFDERDGAQAAPVAVINETLARKYWPGESALGHRLQLGSGGPDVWRTIVGVVRDVRERGYEAAQKPITYLPYAQNIETWARPEYLVVRTSGEPTSAVGVARAAVAAVDAEQPISAVRTMEDIVDLDVSTRSQQATLLGTFAALAVLLASVGLYGVLSYAVTQRSREIGLRIALGASSLGIVWLVVVRGVALTGAGLAFGMAGALAATRAMQGLLYGVTPGDPGTFIIVVAVLTTVGFAACIVPALRATRLSPLQMLREE